MRVTYTDNCQALSAVSCAINAMLEATRKRNVQAVLSAVLYIHMPALLLPVCMGLPARRTAGTDCSL
jgi:hypothetical protein